VSSVLKAVTTEKFKINFRAVSHFTRLSKNYLVPKRNTHKELFKEQKEVNAWNWRSCSNGWRSRNWCCPNV